MRLPIMFCIAAMTLANLMIGCAKVSQITGSTWHHKCGWKAEDYFDDPQVIALCKAIEANDLAEVDRLVSVGVDVNTQGKGKMTPLLWAFPDNKLERFKRLLELGASPNVIIESDFDSHGAMRAGDSVTHMAAKTYFPGYCKAVFEHGGDPNLLRTSVLGSGDTPIFSVIQSAAKDKPQNIQLLIEKGADLNHVNASGITPTRWAVGWGGQYDIALMLLKAGADYRLYQPQSNSRLIHRVVEEELQSAQWTPQQKADYQKLVKWLVEHGESVEEAKADKERWKSWSITTGEFARKMDAEIAQRKAREAREKRAAEEAE